MSTHPRLERRARPGRAAIILCGILAGLSGLPVSAFEGPDAEPRQPESTASAREDDEDDGKPAEEAEEKPAPAVPRIAPFFPFGGRFMFRRNFVAPMAGDAKTDEEGEAPRGVTPPDNGDVRRRLDKIRGQISEKHYGDAARQLGPLLQSTEIRDFFLNRDEQRRGGRSFRAEVRAMIRELPEEGRVAYRVAFEAVARNELSAAVGQGSESALRDVARRFPFTQSGDEAAYRLAHWLSDHGRPAATIACLERLRSEAGGGVAMEAGLVRLLESCRQAIGSDSSADDADWGVYRGDPTRNRAVTTGEPFLAARWTREIATHPPTRLALDHKRQSNAEGRGTWLPMLHPLGAGELVLVRTASGVAAHHVETGEVMWRCPSDDDPHNAGIDGTLWQEPCGGSFSADGECFYLLEKTNGAAGHPAATATVLTAREHFLSREGRLRWSVGGAAGGSEPALAGVAFLGPPVPWQGRLYVQIEGKGSIALAALDARTGRLEWSQELAVVETSLAEDPLRRLAGAAPSLAADEIVVCPTSGGAVVAVDLTTQSLLWVYRYSRRAPPNVAIDGEFLEATAASLDQRDRWLDGTAILCNGNVIVAPPDSAELHCLDLRDGRPRWTQPRGDALFVACATADRVVTAGKAQLQAWNLSDGRPAWAGPAALPASAYTCGRGAFTGEKYYLPVSSGGIVRIDLQRGAIDGEYRSRREVAPGNLILHRGAFISQGSDYLQAIDQRETVERFVAETLRRDPRDAAALLRRGELLDSGGDADGALTAFRQAHAAAPSPRTRSRLTSALLDALRRRGEQEPLQRELDKLADERFPAPQ